MDSVLQVVRNRYGKIAQRNNCGCGCSSYPSTSSNNPNQSAIAVGYSQTETDSVPEGANLGLGCGNPQSLAKLKPGETVLDLGSGGGFDCFLAAKKVGAQGMVIGVDMTAEMISKARKNAQKGDFSNVEFRLGEIEHLPVANQSVHAIISNCVINLSPDKQQVFQECFRVLMPGGRLAISDIIALAPIAEEHQKDMEAFSCCLSGAETADDIRTMLINAGFSQIEIRPNLASQDVIKEKFPHSPIASSLTSASIEAQKE